MAPQPGIDNHFRQLKTYHARAKGQNIGVVMLPRKLRRIGFAAHHRTNAGYLLAAIEIPTPVPQIRIPSTSLAEWPARQRWHNADNRYAQVTMFLIQHVDPHAAEMRQNIVFKDKPDVIAANCNPFHT
jgi:hypothetical protein